MPLQLAELSSPKMIGGRGAESGGGRRISVGIPNRNVRINQVLPPSLAVSMLPLLLATVEEEVVMTLPSAEHT